MYDNLGSKISWFYKKIHMDLNLPEFTILVVKMEPADL